MDRLETRTLTEIFEDQISCEQGRGYGLHGAWLSFTRGVVMVHAGVWILVIYRTIRQFNEMY